MAAALRNSAAPGDGTNAWRPQGFYLQVASIPASFLPINCALIGQHPHDAPNFDNTRGLFRMRSDSSDALARNG